MSEQPNLAELAACPDAARPVFGRYLAGEISAEIALMRLLLVLGGMTPLRECLAAMAADPATRALHEVMARNEAALAGAARLVETGLARERAGDIATIREQFDRAVAISPEAAVALY
jgi:hypothetical protein